MPSTRPNSGKRTVLGACLAIFLVIGVRLSFIRQVSFCGVPDSCSYFSLAQSLATRHVFQAQFADNLQLEHVTLPATGIEYWRPGTSFLLLLARPFGNITLHSSLVVTLLAGLLTALAAWHMAMRFNQDRSLAALGVLLCFTFPAIWDSSLIPDSGLYYAAAVAWFLALFTVRFQGYVADALALACVAVAYLIRNDAVILIVPLMVVLLLRHRRRHTESDSLAGSSLSYCALILLGFLVALAPMHIIDYLVLGKPFSGAASRVLFFNDLSDSARYGTLVNLHSWLSVGMTRLIKLRLTTLPLITYRILFVVLGPGLIFISLSILRRRADGSRSQLPEIAGGLTFFGTLLAVYGIILPAIGSFSALRTSFGLLPLASILILVSIRNFVPGRAAGVLSTAMIAYYLISGVMYGRRTVAELAQNGAQMRSYGEFLHLQGVDPRTARIITDDPGQIYVTTGYSSVQLPVNGVDAIAQLASDLHATHVLVDANVGTVSPAELRSRLHPIATAAMPNSSVILLTLSAPP